MRFDLAPDKAAALEQALISGSSSRVLSVMRRPRSRASVSQAAMSERTIPRPRARRDRHPGDMERIAVETPKHRGEERAAYEDPKSAARRELGRNRRSRLEEGR